MGVLGVHRAAHNFSVQGFEFINTITEGQDLSGAHEGAGGEGSNKLNGRDIDNGYLQVKRVKEEHQVLSCGGKERGIRGGWGWCIQLVGVHTFEI